MGLSIPKQYIEVNGRPIIDWCVSTFARRADIEKIIIVVHQNGLAALTSAPPVMQRALSLQMPGRAGSIRY